MGAGPERVARASLVARGKREAEAAGGRLEPRSAYSAGESSKKSSGPRVRRELAHWAEQAHQLSERRAARRIPVHRATLRYQHHRDPQEALRGSTARTGRQSGALRLLPSDGDG